MQLSILSQVAINIKHSTEDNNLNDNTSETTGLFKQMCQICHGKVRKVITTACIKVKPSIPCSSLMLQQQISSKTLKLLLESSW